MHHCFNVDVDALQKKNKERAYIWKEKNKKRATFGNNAEKKHEYRIALEERIQTMPKCCSIEKINHVTCQAKKNVIVHIKSETRQYICNQKQPENLM